MKINIDCHCGRNYDAEFEPVDGKVPHPIVCPACGTDATESINAALPPVEAPPPLPRPKLRRAESVIHLASPTPAAATATPTEVPPHCFRHTDKPVEMFCFVCKKPMCAECMEMYGFVCSPYCRQQAKAQGIEIPEYEKQRDVVARHEQKRGKLIALAVVAVLIALLGVYVWYTFWGSKPHVVRTVDLGQGSVEYCRFIGPKQLLVASARRVGLYDTGAGKAIWTAASPAPKDEDFEGGGLGGVFVTAQDIWLQRGKALVRLDRQTGAEKGKVEAPGYISRVTQTDSSLVIDTPAESHQMRLTQVDLATGKSQTQVAAMLFVPERERPMRSFDEGSFDTAEVSKPHPIEALTQFVAAGPNVAQLDIRVTKTNIVSYKAIKDTGDKRADNEMRVSETMAIAEEIMTDMARQKTGGVRWEDESTYKVTLHRVFGDGIADLSFEVTGRPALFAMKSVDVLVAGKQLMVFDKKNQKLWDAKLQYTVAEHYMDRDSGYGSEDHVAPCVEMGDTLYVFDQGVLTAFLTKTGQVRWRLASVGISQIEFDSQGKLYITTTTASPDEIQYTQQVKIRGHAEPVILKVDPATGQTLWKLEKTGEHFYLADGYVYFTKSTVSGLEAIASLGRGKGAPVHFRIFRVDPKKGKTLWEYHREGGAEQLAFQRTVIALVADGQLEILDYLTF